MTGVFTGYGAARLVHFLCGIHGTQSYAKLSIRSPWVLALTLGLFVTFKVYARSQEKVSRLIISGSGLDYIDVIPGRFKG